MSKKSRFQFLVAVHCFFVREDSVLLLERANTGYMDGYFSVPAGHVDGGEGIWQAAQREIHEEIGILVQEVQQPVHVMHRAKVGEEERIDYFFLIKDWEGKEKNNEPDKCDHIEWVKRDQLPENTIPYIKFAFEQIENGSLFSEFEEK